MKKSLAKAVFKTYNALKGNAISAHTKKLLAWKSMDGHELQKHTAVFLTRNGFNPNLNENPVQTKADIKYWTEKVPEELIATWAYTGGSYGEPLRVPYSKNRNFVRTATFKYFNELAGYNLGDPFVLIRAKNKPRWEKLLRNEHIFIPHDTSVENLEKFAIYLVQHKIEVLMGYPSVMYALAIFLHDHPSLKKNIKVKSMISVSEPLEMDKREFIQKVFDCEFVDRYSNEEVGLICQQDTFGGPYQCNSYGIITEIVDPITCKAVNTGEKGKVLVTDLTNDLIPIVRYDTGDLAIAGEYNEGYLKSILSIEGRVTEQIFSTVGKPISPLMLGPYIYKPLSRQDKVFQYQFAQVEKEAYELRVKAQQGELSVTLKNELMNGLLPLLGANARLQILELSDILPQPSGKRPVFKNEVSK
ncbi:MAG: hypothetical protein ACXIT9_12490 [Nitritalea sp.]